MLEYPHYLDTSVDIPDWKRLQEWQRRAFTAIRTMSLQNDTSQVLFLANADIPRDDLEVIANPNLRRNSLQPPKGFKGILGIFKGRSKSVDLTNDDVSLHSNDSGDGVQVNSVQGPPRHQTDWTGVTIHANLNITFRPRRPHTIRTCVSNLPLKEMYYDLLVSELGRGNGKPGEVSNHPSNRSRYDDVGLNVHYATNFGSGVFHATPMIQGGFENPQKLTHIDPTLPEDYRLAVGFVTRPFPPFVLPGHYGISVALCFAPYEGLSIVWTDAKNHTKTEYLSWRRHPGITLKVGDVIRCHFSPQLQQVWFELNGDRLTPTVKMDKNLWGKDVKLYPAVGCNHGAQVLCSMGEGEEEIFEWGDVSPVYDGPEIEGRGSEDDFVVPAWIEKS